MLFPISQLILGTLIVGHDSLTQAAVVSLPPSVDPFYQPPVDYIRYQPGELLRWRAIDYSKNISTSAKAFQLLYRSQDSQGLPSAGVTTVFVPDNSNGTLGKIISLQTAYDSTATDFSPSYFLTSDPNSLQETSLVSSYLTQGWAVSVPDFEGFLPAFGNGVQAGYSTLDSIRAVLHSSSVTNLDSAAKVALVGGSGGAIGSEFALEFLNEYSPELSTHVVGALLLSLVPNGNATVVANDGALTAGLIPLILQGLVKQDPVLAEWLSGVVLPDQAAQFFTAATQKGADFAVSWAFRKSDSYLVSSDVLQQAIPQEAFRKLATMGLRDTPSHPMFFYKGAEDTLSPIVDTDTLISEYCSRGADIVYQRSTNADHGLSGAYGAIAGFPWLADRLNGIKAAKGCDISNVTVPASFKSE